MTGRYNTDDENDLIRQFATLEKRVRALESTNQIGNSSLDKGTLSAFQPDGTRVFEAGELHIGIANAWGMATRRSNDTFAFYVFSKDDGSGFWALLDKSGNIIASEDGASGQGLATPWLAIPNWVPNTSIVPTDTTTSATFIGLQNVRYIKQHPKVHVEVLVRSSDGSTTGEVRLFNLTYSEDIGALITVTAGMYQRFTITGAVLGTHKQSVELEMQGRRTSGAGTIGVRVMGSYGRQT